MIAKSSRTLFDPVILSLLPHLIVFWVIEDMPLYEVAFATSLWLSCAWHIQHENVTLCAADYTVAALCAVLDLVYTYDDWNSFGTALVLNILIFLSNRSCDHIEPYTTWHSIWHLFAGFKSIYVAQLISKGNPVEIDWKSTS